MMDDAGCSWDALADEYDRWHGEDGNDWHCLLVDPSALALLGDVRGGRILDLGCGTGVLARLLKAGCSGRGRGRERGVPQAGEAAGRR